MKIRRSGHENFVTAQSLGDHIRRYSFKIFASKSFEKFVSDSNDNYAHTPIM